VTEFWLRPQARSDLDTIWDYTVQSWGVQQSRSYIAEIRDTCGKLAENPGLGKCRNELYKELRVFPSGKHLIFYLTIAEGIDVIRILHERMDTHNQLRQHPAPDTDQTNH